MNAKVLLLSCVVAAILVFQPYIQMVVELRLPFWHIDTPIADVVGLILLLSCPLWLQMETRCKIPPLAPAWYGVFLLAALLSTITFQNTFADYSAIDSLKWTLRKPVFFYLAYGFALPLAISRCPERLMIRVLWAALATVVVLSIITSIGRIMAGKGFWWQAIPGLTNNHKTLAVWLAPWVPWLWFKRKEKVFLLLLICAAAALVLSSSKAALLSAVLGVLWWLPYGRQHLFSRARVVLSTAIVCFGLSVGIPSTLHSPTILAELDDRIHLSVRMRMLLDAARSRHSLNLRAWEQFGARPLFGTGPGSSTHFEMHTFPHYRVNGVNAHGAPQQLIGETGLIGLGSWMMFLIHGTKNALTSVGQKENRWAWLGVLFVLHFGLLTSTEVFSMTHWIPLGVGWAGISGAFSRTSMETPCA